MQQTKNYNHKKNINNYKKDTKMPSRLTNENYLNTAEHVVKNTSDITTTQLRNLLQPLSRIDNQLNTNSKVTDDIKNQLTYIELRIIYAAARNPEVMTFVKKAKLRDYIKSASKSYADFKLYHHYFEAIIAFSKYKETQNKMKNRY